MGQEWARKMFNTEEHDFGNVARYAKTEYRFQIKNLYLEDMHITSVRASCGCTTPTITKRTLKSGETAELIAKFNTHRFVGRHAATVTVRFGSPFSAEVRVKVKGYIRRDVTFDPSRIELGTVPAGQSVEHKVRVNYAGRSDWKITEVQVPNEHFEAKAVEVSRRGGRVTYELQVALRGDAPAGYVNGRITLVTNDRGNTSLPLSVEGRIVSAITVSPATLQLGDVQPGQSVTKQLVVRAPGPFRIVGVACDNGTEFFQFRPSDAERRVHLIPVTFTAPSEIGEVTAQIEIKADGIDGSIPIVDVRANVVAD